MPPPALKPVLLVVGWLREEEVALALESEPEPEPQPAGSGSAGAPDSVRGPPLGAAAEGALGALWPASLGQTLQNKIVSHTLRSTIQVGVDLLTCSSRRDYSTLASLLILFVASLLTFALVVSCNGCLYIATRRLDEESGRPNKADEAFEMPGSSCVSKVLT